MLGWIYSRTFPVIDVRYYNSCVLPAEVADNSRNFNWAGAGTPLFGKGQAPKAAGHDDSQEDGAAHEDSEYDPHYEPVVPMPDEIKVVTGEEDEVRAVFHHFYKK